MCAVYLSRLKTYEKHSSELVCASKVLSFSFKAVAWVIGIGYELNISACGHMRLHTDSI